MLLLKIFSASAGVTPFMKVLLTVILAHLLDILQEKWKNLDPVNGEEFHQWFVKYESSEQGSSRSWESTRTIFNECKLVCECCTQSEA